MKLLDPGTLMDGFTIEECIHSGGMAHIYQVRYTDSRHLMGFPMAMKVPRMTAGDGAENIVSFEIESQIMQVLTGSHVPRFVAAGDLSRVPYLVMEYVHGRTLQHWLDAEMAPSVGEIIHLGVAMAHAVHALLQTGDTRCLKQARKQFMQKHGTVFAVLGIMQWFWYRNEKRRERFVKICEDRDVQQLTFESYMNKELVRKKPMAHVRIFFKDMAHLLGLARV